MDFNEKGFLGASIVEFSKSVEQKYEPFFETCYHVNTLAQDTKFKFNIHNRDGQEVIAATLFIRVLNGFQGVVVLARMGLATEAKVVLRGTLEAFFLLKLTCDEERFAIEYIQSDKVHRLRWMNIAHQSSGQMFDSTRRYATPEIMRTLQDEINKHGIKEWKIEDIARRANLHELYDSDYRLLSAEVHIIPRSLENYTHTDSSGAIVDFPWGPSDDDLGYILFTAVRILFNSLVCTTKLFEVDILEQCAGIDQRLTRLAPLLTNKVRDNGIPS